VLKGHKVIVIFMVIENLKKKLFHIFMIIHLFRCGNLTTLEFKNYESAGFRSRDDSWKVELNPAFPRR